MKLTAMRVLNAYQALRCIIQEGRVLPQIGAYRLARMHALLEPDALLIEEKRTVIVKALAGDTPNGPNGKGWQVPEEKMEEYQKQWKELGAEEIEIANLFPVSLAALGEAPSVHVGEFLQLGELIEERG